MDKSTHDVRSSQWLEIITSAKNRPEGHAKQCEWLTMNQ